ncbi:polyphenol oxidase, chloroplastic [Lactuca sativa]|uniref:polyphenol oxidase, chloroplastic n=1 Tax=Lactuca sativa TaxID=4236 RepID=UPI001C68CBCA|nr:polyphenol oxidase, chloroplastic [Lactuca sativa]
MASLSFTLAMATTPSSSPFFSKPANQRQLIKTHAKQTHRFQMSCNVPSDDHEKPVDRRNLLLGLGGLYSAVNLTGLPSAFADPITTPSFNPNCRDAGTGFDVKKGLLRTTACCPPESKKGPEKQFEFPKHDEIRIRYPIHCAPEGYMNKFKEAMRLMRALPDDDPRSFKNQAKIHCAYCNGSYTQMATGSQQELLIHFNWLFFPFHRWYLYFFERILGELIGDPTFGLPYWSWDEREGMKIPPTFREGGESNPLYDIYRNNIRNYEAIVDLDFNGKDREDTTDDYQIKINQHAMYRQMMRNAFDTKSFFGGKYVAGNTPIDAKDSSVASIEAGCHTAIHRWVRDPGSPNGEDMGNFYSAGYDPLFYVHHSNVDRMWALWKEMGESNRDPIHPDWLNASYVFYDEKQNPVRVYNKQCVDMEKLKYKYHGPEIPSWVNSRPKPKCSASERSQIDITSATKDVKNRTLTNVDTFVLVRPETARTRTVDESEIEVLTLNNISFNGNKAVKFDVLVNACNIDTNKFTPADSEYAGSFATVPHNHDMKISTTFRFPLRELLKDIGAEGNTAIQVTIVTQEKETENISIGEIKIEDYSLAEISKASLPTGLQGAGANVGVDDLTE